MRDDAVVAELSLQLGPDGTVDRYIWEGAPEMRDFCTAALPGDPSGALLEEWQVAVTNQCAKIPGLLFSVRYEGVYAPSDNMVTEA